MDQPVQFPLGLLALAAAHSLWPRLSVKQKRTCDRGTGVWPVGAAHAPRGRVTRTGKPVRAMVLKALAIFDRCDSFEFSGGLLPLAGSVVSSFSRVEVLRGAVPPPASGWAIQWSVCNG